MKRDIVTSTFVDFASSTLRRPQTDPFVPTSYRLYRYFQKPGILMLGSFLLFPFLFSFWR
jgi:hypothetical protein